MRLFSRVIAAMLAACVSAPLVARAQGSMIVLRLPASARAAALGNAYVAGDDDDALLFYNPAQLRTDSLHFVTLGVSVQRYMEAATAAAVSASRPAGPGRIAFGLQALDYGSEPEIVPDPEYGGERGKETGSNVNARDFAVTLGYGMHIAPVRIGGAFKMVNQQIVELSAFTTAIDLGAALPTRLGTLGVVMQNSGGMLRLGSSTTALPLLYRAGVQFRPLSVGRAQVATLLEATKLRDIPASWSGGAELRTQTAKGVLLSARAGFRARVSDTPGSRLTLGGGFASMRYGLDYAYQSVEGLEVATHRIGFRWWR